MSFISSSRPAAFTAFSRSLRLGLPLALGLTLTALLLWLCGAAPPVRAATLDVCPSGCTYATIQDAVNAAAPTGDTINIAAGTYAEHVIVGTKQLTFVGAGADSTFVDGSESGRVFSVTATSAAFSDLTIQNGRVTSESGGGIYAAAALTLTNVDVLSNTVAAGATTVQGGGGVRVLGDLYVSGGRFENNLATGTVDVEGGAILSRASAAPHPNVTISGATFISNTAKYGGAISLAASVWLTNTQFISNSAATKGGGVFSSSGGTLTLSGGRFERNAAGPITPSPRGGGLYFYGAAVLEGTEFISNTVSGGTGGGMYVASGLTMTGARFVGNTAEGAAGSGGGLYAVNYASPRTVEDTDFISNTAGQYGGGLYVGGGPLTLTNSRFISNTSYLAGGGARLYGATTVVDSEFTSNVAISVTGGSGGGLYLDSTATVTGTDFSSNWSGNLGGGLYVYGTATLTNSQFTGNTATVGGGGLYARGAATLTGSQFTSNNVTNGNGGGLFAYASLVMTDTQLIRNSAANGGGIYVSGNTAGASRMVNALLAANSAATDGAALYLYSAGSGGARTATIVHTTIASPTVGASQAIFVGKPSSYAPTVNITNTIIASYTTGISVTAGAVVNSDYNYFNNAPTSVAIGSHSISGTEHYLLFVDAAADNYRPVLGSPAPTHGINLGVAADLDGVTRSDPPTIGAYEGTPYPNVWLNKAVTPITDVPYHGVVTYTLDLNNTGSLTDTVRLTDTLPAGVTFGGWVSAPEEGVLRDGNVITWTGVITDLEAAITLVFTATHTGNYGDVIANTAWFSGSAQAGSAAASFSVEACISPFAVEVQNTDDSGPDSLRQALADVCPGGTITFLPALTASGAATITLASGELAVTKNVTITGPGANLLAVSGNNAARVFYVNSGMAAAISGLTIRDGNSGGDGGGIYSAGALTLDTSRVVSNTAANGGGLYQGGSSAGRVVNTLFARNTAVTNGAAMYLGSSGAVDVLHNTIANPAVGAAAAIHVDGGTVNITNTIVASHTVGIQQAAGAVTAWNTLFNGNTTDIGGTVTNNDPVAGDPLFVDPANGDYHLGPASPAVDAGVDAGVTTDYDGDARPQGLGYDIGYDEVLQQCALSTGVDYLFASPTITLTFTDLNDVNCAAAVYFPRSHAHATGSVGNGVGADHFWQIVARTEGGAEATGFTARLTAPIGGVANPELCYYTGTGTFGWDCTGSTNNGNGTMSRNVTHFSDWAMGNHVGPNAVRLATFEARGETWAALRAWWARLVSR